MPLRFAGPLLAAFLAAPLDAHPGHHHLRPPAQSAVAEAQEELGRCAGAEPGAPPRVIDGAPFELKEGALSAEERQLFVSLDYRIDEKAGRLLNPDGTPVAGGEVERLRAPFDASREKLGANQWSWMMTSGVRLDEKTCAFKDTAGTFSRLKTLSWEMTLRRSMEHSALEDLRSQLSKLKPGDPLPDGVHERAALMEKQGLLLPPAVKKALQEASTAGKLVTSVDAAYADSTRFFDQGGWSGTLGAAVPALRGALPAQETPTYVGDPERKLGEALNGDIRTVLGEHPTGRELLTRFKDSKGKPDLPPVLVVKMSQRPGEGGYGNAAAVAFPDGSFIALNYWYTREAALANAPPAERAALAKKLMTPEAMQDWLLANPTARQNLVRTLDGTLLHELVHAWQGRRGRFEVEMLRGNTPQVNPLEKEHEAYRTEMLYFHDKLLKDPATAVNAPEFATYQSLIADYGQYKDAITRLYMTTFPGSSDYKTAADLQVERRRVSARLGLDGWLESGRQALRRVGFEWGDASMRNALNDSQAREKAFEEAHLPALRREGSEALVAHFDKTGHPALALGAARLKGSTATKERRIQLFEKALAELRRPGGDVTLRAQAVGQLAGYLMERETDGPADFTALQTGIYSEAAKDYMGRADAAPSVAEKALWLERAEAYAKAAKDEKLLRAVARRRGGKK